MSRSLIPNATADVPPGGMKFLTHAAVEEERVSVPVRADDDAGRVDPERGLASARVQRVGVGRRACDGARRSAGDVDLSPDHLPGVADAVHV